jgi:thioredoxin reductase (NADPH)
MSSYLANRIRFLDNVEVVPQPDVTALEGENGFLGGGRWCRQGLSEVRRPIRLVFLFIGADPNCAWLADAGVAVDGSGFVPTGTREGTRTLETSHPGVFAIGDIRSGSAKRVATAVGDGAQAVANLHVYLATLDGRETRPPRLA